MTKGDVQIFFTQICYWTLYAGVPLSLVVSTVFHYGTAIKRRSEGGNWEDALGTAIMLTGVIIFILGCVWYWLLPDHRPAQ